MYAPLMDFLTDLLDRPPVKLPAMGLLRYDDVPGTAAQQLSGQDKPDRKVVRRVRRLSRVCADSGAVLNVAVTARALDGGEEVPLDRIWPRSVEAIAEGIRDGTFEQIAHGYLHLAPGSTEGNVESREFGGLDREEAERRIGSALEWAEQALGVRPRSFVAPNWVYSPGSLEALAAIGLPAFLPCEPAPLTDGSNVRESLVSTVDGLHGLDYRPLTALAEAGVPPYVVVHGGLIDSRFNGLDLPRDAVTLARLAVRRDMFRLPRVPGVRWVGASELIERLAEHDRVDRGA
jgi:predicted deacetylase